MTANSACLAESVAIDKLPVPTMPNHNNNTDNTHRRHQQHQQQQHQQPLTNNLSNVCSGLCTLCNIGRLWINLTMRARAITHFFGRQMLK